MRKEELKKELENVINKLGIDSSLNIPDYVLANYLIKQLEVLCETGE